MKVGSLLSSLACRHVEGAGLCDLPPEGSEVEMELEVLEADSKASSVRDLPQTKCSTPKTREGISIIFGSPGD